MRKKEDTVLYRTNAEGRVFSSQVQYLALVVGNLTVRLKIFLHSGSGEYVSVAFNSAAVSDLGTDTEVPNL